MQMVVPQVSAGGVGLCYVMVDVAQKDIHASQRHAERCQFLSYTRDFCVSSKKSHVVACFT